MSIAKGATFSAWQQTTIGQVCKISTGKLDVNASVVGGEYPFFTCAERIYQIDQYAFDTEAVLFAGNGDFNVKYYKGKFNAYQRTYVLHDLALNGRYLFHYISHQMQKITGGSRGSTIKYIRLSDLRDHSIAVPSHDVQAKIVGEIEMQLSRLDAAVANLQHVKANLKRYKAAVLKDAVEGRLVPTEAELARSEGRSFETAEQLLQRILETRRMEWKGRGAFFESSGASVGMADLPAGWVWTTLGQCFRVAVGATPSRKEPSYWGGDIPWVSSGEVKLGRIRHTDEHISAAGLANSSTQLNPAGSVMIGMIGQGKTRGQAAILDIEAANNQNCAAIWVSRTAIPTEYVFFWLMSRYTETRSEGSGNNQQALNKRLVEQIPLPLPPLAEQQRIVAEVDRRLSRVCGVEAEVDANLKRAQALRQSTLSKAFFL